MKDYKRLTKRDDYYLPAKTLMQKKLNRLTWLENTIECGEIDYVAEKDAEIARLTEENADLHARLDKAVILPCKCEDTLYCVHWSKYNSKGGIITEEFVHKITLNDRNNTYTIHTICNGIWTESKFVAIDFGDILFTDRAKAEARLAELKGGEK